MWESSAQQLSRRDVERGRSAQSHISIRCSLLYLARALQVVAAQSLQLQQVNTNSRYLSEVHSQYLRALAARFPDPLKLLYLVNSGSEANDLASQIAMAARPGAAHIACMDLSLIHIPSPRD